MHYTKKLRSSEGYAQEFDGAPRRMAPQAERMSHGVNIVLLTRQQGHQYAYNCHMGQAARRRGSSCCKQLQNRYLPTETLTTRSIQRAVLVLCHR